MNNPTDKPEPGHLFSNPDYRQWLLAVKKRNHFVRIRIALAANSEFEIGAQIVEREAHAHWGSGFID